MNCLTLNGQLGRIFFGTAILLAVVAAPVQSMVAAPAEWRQLSRLQVNPPEIQAFVETSFSYNQLKADPGGDLYLGFTAVRNTNPNKDTDVFVSRFVRTKDRWGSPVSHCGEFRPRAIPRGLGRRGIWCGPLLVGWK